MAGFSSAIAGEVVLVDEAVGIVTMPEKVWRKDFFKVSLKRPGSLVASCVMALVMSSARLSKCDMVTSGKFDEAATTDGSVAAGASNLREDLAFSKCANFVCKNRYSVS